MNRCITSLISPSQVVPTLHQHPQHQTVLSPCSFPLPPLSSSNRAFPLTRSGCLQMNGVGVGGRGSAPHQQRDARPLRAPGRNRGVAAGPRRAGPKRWDGGERQEKGWGEVSRLCTSAGGTRLRSPPGERRCSPLCGAVSEVFPRALGSRCPSACFLRDAARGNFPGTAAFVAF